MPKKNKKESPPTEKAHISVNKGSDEKGCLMDVTKKALLTILIIIGLVVAGEILEEIGEFFDKIF